MKKIFLVVPSLANGGQEKIAIDTAKVLKNEYDVKVVLFHRSEKEYEYDGEKECLSVLPSSSVAGKVIGQIKRIYKLCKLRNREKPDVVYSFGDTANITNIVSGIFSKGKSIASIHGFSSVNGNVTNKFLYGKADKVLCISKAMGEEFKAKYTRNDNMSVVENGYDIDEIVEKSMIEAELTPADIQFIAVGRLESVKGYDRLIKAFSEVLDVVSNARLSFIGGGTQKEELKKLCAELNLEDKVSFLGHQKNPYAFMRKADVFMLSSHSEGFPNALIEALACGLACICVDCQSGPREILSEVFSDNKVVGIEKREYGVLTEYSEDDVTVIDNLARAMIGIAKDSELLQIYKGRSIQRANKFSITSYKEKIVGIIEDLCGSKS